MFKSLLKSSKSTPKSSTSSSGTFSHPSTSNPGAASAQSNVVLTEPCAIYLILWSRDDTSTFHWGLYLARTETQGILYYQINDNTRSEGWELAIQQRRISHSRTLLVALKVGTYSLGTSGDGVQYLTDTVKGVERGPTGTCRTWAMDALFELADSGLIDMQPNKKTKENVEQGATLLAMRAASRGVKLVARSEHTQG